MKLETHSAYLKIINAGYGIKLECTEGSTWLASAHRRGEQLPSGVYESAATDLRAQGRGDNPEAAIADLFGVFSVGVNALISLSDWAGKVNGQHTYHLRGTEYEPLIGYRPVTEADNENSMCSALADLIHRGGISVNGARRLLDRIERRAS